MEIDKACHMSSDVLAYVELTMSSLVYTLLKNVCSSESKDVHLLPCANYGSIFVLWDVPMGSKSLHIPQKCMVYTPCQSEYNSRAIVY